MNVTYTSTTTANNYERCWMNISVTRLNESVDKKEPYGFICDIGGEEKYYLVSARSLLRVFNKNAISQIKSNPIRWSFYFAHKTGEIYATSSPSNTNTVIKCDPCEKEQFLHANIDKVEAQNVLEELNINKLNYDSDFKGRNEFIENRNFYELAYLLSDYGLECVRIVNDGIAADILAYHRESNQTITIQLKGHHINLRKDYITKENLYVAIADEKRNWYIVLYKALASLDKKKYKFDGKKFTLKWNNELKQILRPCIIPGKKRIK